jgi:hypothetical protein
MELVGRTYKLAIIESGQDTVYYREWPMAGTYWNRLVNRNMSLAS